MTEAKDKAILRKMDGEKWETSRELGIPGATLKRLERAGFVASRERGAGRPDMEYRLTGAGLHAVGRK